MFPQNQDQGQQQQSLPNIEDFFKQIPFGSRMIYAILIALWIIDLMSNFTANELVANGDLIFASPYQIWRLFTASYSQTSLLYLTINIISLHTILPKLEFRMNTMWLLITYTFLGVFIQTISASIAFWLVPFKVASGDSFGIWFNFMFKYCYFNRTNKIKFCCFKWMIPKIAYPFVMVMIIALLDFFEFLRIDILIGIFIAFVQCKLFKGNLCRCLNNCGFFRLSQYESWVEASQSRNWMDGPYASLEEDLGRLQDNSDDENQSSFKNKKGVRLSDG